MTKGSKKDVKPSCAKCPAFGICEKVDKVYEIFHPVPASAPKAGDLFRWTDLFFDTEETIDKVFETLAGKCKIYREIEAKNLRRKDAKDSKGN